MAIFNSYVKLPEGRFCGSVVHLISWFGTCSLMGGPWWTPCDLAKTLEVWLVVVASLYLATRETQVSARNLWLMYLDAGLLGGFLIGEFSYFQPETQKYSNCQNGECSKVWGTVNVTPSELGRRTSIYQASPSPIQDLPKASSERFRVFVRKLRTQDFFHVQRCSVLTCLTFLKQSLTDWRKHGRNWIGQPDRENSWSFWVFACWRASSEHRARGRHLGSHRLCGQCQDHVSSVQDGHVRLQMMTSLQACALACDGPQRFYGMC